MNFLGRFEVSLSNSVLKYLVAEILSRSVTKKTKGRYCIISICYKAFSYRYSAI